MVTHTTQEAIGDLIRQRNTLRAALFGAETALHNVYIDWDGDPGDMQPVLEARDIARAALKEAEE